jgi:hypothetical protein
VFDPRIFPRSDREIPGSALPVRKEPSPSPEVGAGWPDPLQAVSIKSRQEKITERIIKVPKKREASRTDLSLTQKCY